MLKNLPQEKQDELWEILKAPGFSIADSLARASEIAERPISSRQFISWRVWYYLCRRSERLHDVIDALPARVDATSGDSLREHGLILLMAEALEREDGEGFVAAARAHLAGRELQVNVEKFRELVKTQTDKALEAFAAEIKGNTKALAAFAQMKKAVEAAITA